MDTARVIAGRRLPAILLGAVLAAGSAAWSAPNPHGCAGGCMAGIYTARGSASFDGKRFIGGGTLSLIAGTPGVTATRTFAIVLTFRNTPSAIGAGTLDESTGEGGEHSHYSITAIRNGSNMAIVGEEPPAAASRTGAITGPGFVVGQLVVKASAFTGRVMLDPPSIGHGVAERSSRSRVETS